MYLSKLTALLIGGALVTEGTGYLWHRWACHTGVFRLCFKDLLRRRHFDHHTNKYAGAGLRHDTYYQSCDIAFRVLGVSLVAFVITLATIDLIGLDAATALLLGIFTHAFLGTKLHALYHVSDRSARCFPILKWDQAWRAFSWLREFHDVHHVVNANYSLVLPLFDLIGGTYISPKKIPRLQAENLFPRFDSELSSSCEKPLF
jgi:sterol desaturase/sphingolipid hydroxylase (fatty acid hydroxylase superfamily)